MTPWRQPLNRRTLIRSMVGGSVLLPAIVSELLAGESSTANPLSPRPAHYPARAKRVI